jgi:hypothetical protein
MFIKPGIPWYGITHLLVFLPVLVFYKGFHRDTPIRDLCRREGIQPRLEGASPFKKDWIYARSHSQRFAALAFE